MEHQSCVQLVPIFNHLDQQALDEILEVAVHKRLKKNEYLYQQGDSSEMLYIIASGEIHVSNLNENGKEMLISILKEGDFVGELSIITKTEHENYAVATKETEMCTISYTNFQRLLIKYPSISLQILEELSNRLQKSQSQALINSTLQVSERLSKYLSDTQGKLTMTKKNLASYLGTTPESISRLLTQFEEDGYLRKKSSKEFELLKEFEL